MKGWKLQTESVKPLHNEPEGQKTMFSQFKPINLPPKFTNQTSPTKPHQPNLTKPNHTNQTSPQSLTQNSTQPHSMAVIYFFLDGSWMPIWYIDCNIQLHTLWYIPELWLLLHNCVISSVFTSG